MLSILGTRGSVEKNLAWMDLMIVLAKLVFAFELRQDLEDNLGGGSPNNPLGHQDPDKYQVYDVFVAGRDWPMVRF